MLKPNNISHIDNFGDQIIFDVIVDCDYKSLIKKAQKIGEKDYSKRHFVVRVEFTENGFHTITDTGNSELYYIDTDGNYASLDYMLKKTERTEILKCCRNEILSYLGASDYCPA